MDLSTLLGIAFLLICVLFIFLLVAISKINSLHRKVTDVSPKDLYPFMEELRELVIESERVADKLEDSVKQKEEMLEDISSMLDDKLQRLETIQESEPTPTYTPSSGSFQQRTATRETPTHQPAQSAGTNIRDKISEMVSLGLSDIDIAAKLGISTTEVQIVKRMDIG
ncbi:MAG: hypothetical protein C0602_04285 [Denitrovibrio sp.]|nr:MAG: hypothetical protein C0602_04285 [Denitrovibrio sp.]